ncbi:hypothetical protein RHMOL_Rhmol06G0007200 [Rhododendron molle]|uniref:Uncharacterized protein n=1 Tax=Rhododendron molle TaxID=49168 RepID=A0ACC0N7F5_RHOML|nr:hypothetical protein RHMOL_Rhmol06G0007200 [Rhododendron molle]
MAMADHGSESSGSNVIDHPGDEGASMEPEVEDQMIVKATTGEDATVAKGDVEGSVVSGNGSGDIGNSGARGSDGTDGDDTRPSGSPPRDTARGKGTVMEEMETIEVSFTYREEDVLFQPAATSSSQRPITKHDVAEYLSDEGLAKLLEDNPAIGLLFLKAKEERTRAIADSEAVERAEREQKEREEPLRDAEAKKRVRAEAEWPRVITVAEAEKLKLPDFSEVPNEWVNEAVRRMLVMDNVIRRATSGMPLELHYPAPTPTPTQ